MTSRSDGAGRCSLRGAACEALVARALDAGGRDNITVVVATYTWEDTVQ